MSSHNVPEKTPPCTNEEATSSSRIIIVWRFCIIRRHGRNNMITLYCFCWKRERNVRTIVGRSCPYMNTVYPSYNFKWCMQMTDDFILLYAECRRHQKISSDMSFVCQSSRFVTSICFVTQSVRFTGTITTNRCDERSNRTPNISNNHMAIYRPHHRRIST